MQIKLTITEYLILLQFINSWIGTKTKNGDFIKKKTKVNFLKPSFLEEISILVFHTVNYDPRETT